VYTLDMDKSDLKKFVLPLAVALVSALVIGLANMGGGWVRNKDNEHRKMLWNINVLRLKNGMSMLEELD